jgi:hypothetical protein
MLRGSDRWSCEEVKLLSSSQSVILNSQKLLNSSIHLFILFIIFGFSILKLFVPTRRDDI